MVKWGVKLVNKVKYVIEVEVSGDERLEDELYVEALVDGGLSNKNLLSESSGVTLIDGISARVVDKTVSRVSK